MILRKYDILLLFGYSRILYRTSDWVPKWMEYGNSSYYPYPYQYESEICARIEGMMSEHKKKEIWKALSTAFPHTIPVLTGFLVLGFAYGVLMQTKGYGVLWAFLMSAIAFCGSMQFVAITLLTTVFNPFHAFILSFIVNARHLFYGLSMLTKYKGLGKLRIFLIYTLCDETFSIACSVEPDQGVIR